MKLDKGFTLVELAIVMIIVGLLIGGVLKGQQLIVNSKITATISEFKGYQAAMYSFRDAYSALPGDMSNATDRVPGCDASNICAGGNGNALIVSRETDSVDGVYDIPVLRTNFSSSGLNEGNLFWKHLALAGLITGVNPSSDIENLWSGSGAWGDALPASSMRGGYEITFATGAYIVGDVSGHFIRITNYTGNNSGEPPGSKGSSPLNPNEAANIDRKLDDGIAITGTVISDTRDGICQDGGGMYQEQSQSKDCILAFIVDG